MKAIWLNHGVLTDIVVNEACSAGCGSFLEGFAKNLGIAVEDIATEAFSSKAPAVLGSRCTVFMNSSVVSEQRRGKGPGDIMAGLCRSIIENVFTKVIRVSISTVWATKSSSRAARSETTRCCAHSSSIWANPSRVRPTRG